MSAKRSSRKSVPGLAAGVSDDGGGGGDGGDNDGDK